jgi:hypothetical protein
MTFGLSEVDEACLACDDENGFAFRYEGPQPARSRLAPHPVRQPVSLPKLDAAFEFPHLCVKHNDDHFRACGPAGNIDRDL